MCLLDCLSLFFFFFKQKTAYEMRISDWSSDVCSSDLVALLLEHGHHGIGVADGVDLARAQRRQGPGGDAHADEAHVAGFQAAARQQIGRASCRESVCQYV